jgi:hypothetical protein
VNQKGSWLIIFLFIVRQRVVCGMPSSPGLAFAGLCLASSRSYLRIGGWKVVRGAQLFGKWSLIILCGVFGGSKIIDVSRTRRGLEMSSSIFFFLLSTLRLQAGLALRVISFVDFFSSLPLPSPPCIFPVY